jgi:CheY-like chemotaxis protein
MDTPMKILVVEDQPTELKLAVHVLSAAGYDFTARPRPTKR